MSSVQIVALVIAVGVAFLTVQSIRRNERVPDVVGAVPLEPKEPLIVS